MKTLQEFSRECGSQEKAAARIGITLSNINRLIKNYHNQKPSPLLVARFKKLGIVWAPLPEMPVKP